MADRIWLLTDNNLSNNDQALYVLQFSDGGDADTSPLSGSGNTFTGSTNGIQLYNMQSTSQSLVLGNSIAPGVNFVIDGNSGLTSVTGTAINLSYVANVTIDGVDLSYREFTRSGTGIRAIDGFNNNLTVKNTTVSNRQTGLTYNPNTTAAGYLLKVEDSNFLNNDLGLQIVQYNAGGFVNNNRIEGNTTALTYATYGGISAIELDATGNYWGPDGAGGPGEGSNNDYTSANVDSSGFVSAVPSELHRDYGDAPIAFDYATSLIDFGARHIASGPTFGTIRDSEADTIPNTLANTDDTTNLPDEEAVTITALVPGQNATWTAIVAGGPAKVDAWIDFNRDGDWDDADEKIADSVDVSDGSNSDTFAVPLGALIGQNYARFRISTEGGLSPYFEAIDGEVQDLVAGSIWVDDNWLGFNIGDFILDADPVQPGNQNAVFGQTAFDTVNGGIAASDPGGLVIVNAGDMTDYGTEAVVINTAGLIVKFQEGRQYDCLTRRHGIRRRPATGGHRH